ncbi:MAG TPA: substrate-binding domain-containing protein [Anaerohalosphaeraceae bacterium]|nr:substrate-binding domain-containing protein [Anaerohalosphaeraceae bacterium]
MINLREKAVRIVHWVRCLLILSAVFSVVGCRPAPDEFISKGKQKDDLRFAFITCAVDAPFFMPVKQGVHDAAAAMGVHCDFMGTAGVDVKKQADMVQQAIAAGYDGIAVNIIDPAGFDQVIQEAVQKGIPVVAFNIDDSSSPNARLSSVNQRFFEAGQKLGRYVLPLIPDHAHVLMTMHDQSVSALEDRLHGIQSILSQKNIQSTVIISGLDSDSGAREIARTLMSHPEIHIILGTGQSDTEAAGKAIEACFSGKEYWSAGFDLSPKTLQLIQDGHIRCTIDQQPYIQGYYPVIQLTHYIRYGIVPSDIDAGAAIIDRQNVSQVFELSKRHYR